MKNMADIKDANDLRQEWQKEGVSEVEQRRRALELMASASTVAEMMAAWAGEMRGADRDKANPVVFGMIARMPKLARATYRSRLAELLGLSLREFDSILKVAQDEKPKGEGPADIVETLGGWFPIKSEEENGSGKPNGWLIDYLYDEEKREGTFAYKNPEGKIGTANFIDIGEKRYIPKYPNALIINKGVLFPNRIGEKKSTRELVAMVEAFINRNYLLDDPFFSRLAAYYVLLTWLYDCFNALPYLRAVGDYNSGKSELMMRIGHMCYRLMVTGGAGSSASLFRGLEEYKGTALMDEMDLADGGDMANDLIKILNLGAMKNHPVWRLDSVTLVDGTKSYEVASYDVFGPKLIAMRKEFRDQAVTSRCLTVKLMGKSPLELKIRGIKLHMDGEFYKQALEIRNLLLRWRLEQWIPEIQVSEDLMDLQVSTRLNQVTMPIKAIARDDPELMEDITRFVRSLNDELILEMGMSKEARVLDALVAICEQTARFGMYLNESGDFMGLGKAKFIYTKYLAQVTNELMDEMNTPMENRTEEDVEDEDEEGKGKKKIRKTTTKELSTQTVGRIARQTLQMPSHRTNKGYVVIIDEERLKILKVKYGLLKVEDLIPPQTSPNSSKFREKNDGE